LDEVHGGGYAPGEIVWGTELHEYQVGDLPIILSVPHGGRSAAEIPIAARPCGHDPYVDELGTELAARSSADRPPSIWYQPAPPQKLDANRTRLTERARSNGDPGWEDYHGLLAAEQASR